ncbi:hypothetical protein [Prevotella sp. 10(H)]|uniref:hypothetical protein n=1 Tax=Prevotella sp. 10(H) TaxID=1158294 RepID=UPI0004A765FF|nr:hypothetical protein [Prevotella sp. 10(H)]
MKIVIYIFLASLIECVTWCNKIVVLAIKYLSYLINSFNRILRKSQRPLFALSIREQRKILKREPLKKEDNLPEQLNSAHPVVGNTKTVLIFRLPELNEAVPFETVEVPLEEPQEPVEMPFPESDEFEEERETLPSEELRKEMEEALFDGYENDLPDDDTSGISVQEMEQAYKVLHNKIPAESVNSDIVANVLYTLNGTDMFKMFINTEESDIMAKSIMDGYIKKYKVDITKVDTKEFNMDMYLE